MLLLGGIATLAACSTPYGTLVLPDYGAPQKSATILVSDPKLYRRESLIEERREEIAYLNTLMKASETIAFTPEIVREVELIRALSLSLGVGSNPAAGEANRHAEAVADLRNEIALTKLQLELAQLRRDAELVRAGFDTQGSPVNTGLGTLSDDTNPAIQPVTAADAEAVITRINALQDSLANRLASTVPGPRAVTITANPIDVFRDRAAYRALLTTARNAASLDELHDSGGNALARLTFQATILPDREGKHDRALGLVDMELSSQSLDDEALKTIYQAWIAYLNSPAASASSDVLRLEHRGNLFSTLYLHRPAADSASSSCTLLNTVPKDGCNYLRLILPKLIDPSSMQPFDANAWNLWVTLINDGDIETRLDNGTTALIQMPLLVVSGLVDSQCQLRNPETGQSNLDLVINAVQAAQLLPAVIPTLIDALQDSKARPDELTKWIQLHRKAIGLIGLVGARACSETSLDTPDPTSVPDDFAVAVKTAATRIRVYDVGPREQVQQLSTTARAADAVSLAAAISAQDVSRGKGLSAAAGYSRRAMGKVEQIERNPLIVGYASAGSSLADQTNSAGFGWVLGPRAGLDTKDEQVALRQTARVHDLSVDISFPGWMPTFDLTVRTVLAPAWGSLSMYCNDNCGTGEKLKDRIIEVRTQPTAADQASLTSLLAGTSLVRRPTLRTIIPSRIKGCEATVLRVEGNHLWRATAVLLGPHRLEGSAIRVLPDLAGVMVEVRQGLALGADAELAILTPYGTLSSSADQLTIMTNTECVKPADLSKPAITSINPSRAGMCGLQEFTLKGRLLKATDGVQINGSPGSLKRPEPDDGTMVRATFTRKQILGAFNGQSSGQLDLLKGFEVIASTAIAMPTTLPCPAEESP